MSNVDLQDPVVQPDSIHDETVVTVTKVKPKRKRSKLLLIGGLILAGLIIWSFMTPKTPEVTSAVVPPPELNTTVGGDVQQSSQEYANSLRTANDQNAARALEQGSTFIPTPEGALRPLEQAQETLPGGAVEEQPVDEAEPVVVRKRAVVPQLKKVNEAPAAQQAAALPPQQQQGEQPENPYIGLISGQMTAVSSVFVPPTSATEELKVSDAQAANAGAVAQEGVPQAAQADAADSRRLASNGDPLLREQQPLDGYDPYQDDPAANDVLAGLNETAATKSAPGQNENVLAPEEQKKTSEVFIAAGDLMYGEVIATVNSDAPMPVLAEVTTGPHKGARMRGTFETDPVSGKLMVNFSQMTKGDVTVPVSAVAVDGFTADSSIRSGIERRYLRRYGTVFAATFIEGLAEGKAEPEKRVIQGSDGEERVVEEKRTSEEALWNGVQKSVSAISGDLTASAPKGPKIYLHSGYPVGILFLDDLREDPDSAQDGA